MGQLPALLHVATCHRHPGCAGATQAAEKLTTCACAFHRHAAKANRELKSEQTDNGSQPLEHDCDSCSICQSLYGPCGVTWTLEVPVEVGDLVLWSPIQIQQHLGVDSLFVAQPRGPPASTI